MTSNPTYPITGIQDGLERGSPDREVPLRVEIDDFYIQDKYATQRSLFLLAMAYFQTEIDYNEKLSYFQIAGTFTHSHSVASQLNGLPRNSRFTPCYLGRPELPLSCPGA